jgi:hypothetical protein
MDQRPQGMKVQRAAEFDFGAYVTLKKVFGK